MFLSFRLGVGLATASLLSSVPATAQPAAQPPVETVHVVIKGGPNAGTYDATGTRGGCSAGATGKGSWGNQLSSAAGDPKAFNSLQLVVPKPSMTGSVEFQMILGFGPIGKRTAEYTVNTLESTTKKTGSGFVKVMDSGKTAQVAIHAVTADNVIIDARIACNTVTRMP
jgi:hypothetical protein